MQSKDTTSKKEQQGQSKLIDSNNMLKNLRSDYFISKFFEFIPRKKLLKTIKYNKSIQKRIDININHYKVFSEQYSSIELEIIPIKGEYGPFINIAEEDKKYYHIYFNDNKENEINNTFINENHNASKINITIDYQVKSFSNLFEYCKCIESISFKQFYRNNVTNMRSMFEGCSSLKELNLNNFNTNKVTDMVGMFSECSSLKELNLNNFNTNKVTDMGWMFSECSSLKELNLNNFITNNVTDMVGMFSECSSLTELNLNNFNTNNVINMYGMFTGCSDELKLKIKSQFKNFEEEAFE